MNKATSKLTAQHKDLIHSDALKVTSHVQREEGEWILNTIMVENVSTPFKYKRKQQYRSLIGHRVNITYYSTNESVAGFDIQIFKVVRLKIS
ncbi:hypothetical protein [Thalassotalea fusca]